MQAALRRALPLSLLTLLGACSSEFENPFANTGRTVPPRASSEVLFAANLHTAQPGPTRELYAVDGDGGALTQLTFCDAPTRACDTSEGSAAPDRQRVIVRRRLDSNGNSRLDDADGEAMLFVDLSRGVEAPLVPATGQVQGIDWSPTGDVLVYAAVGEGGVEDLWRADPNGQNTRNLTASATVRERHPRVDFSGSIAVFERIEAGAKAAVFVFLDRSRQVRVTSGGPGTDMLPGTPYIVGSDVDPDFSPDARLVVFRRLTGLGVGSLGTWDIVTARADGTAVTVIAGGPQYRGAPDWGDTGIVFEESDAATGPRRLVVVQPDGSGRRVLMTAPAGVQLAAPRWLP